MLRRSLRRQRGTTRCNCSRVRRAAIVECQCNPPTGEGRKRFNTHGARGTVTSHVCHHHHSTGDQHRPNGHTRSACAKTLRDELWSGLPAQSKRVENPCSNVHGVDATGEGREAEDCVEKMGNLGHASLDRGDDEDRAGTHGRCLAVDEGVVHGYDEGGGQDRQRVERDDTKVDFPGGHLHAFDIGKCAALGCGSGDDVHSDVGEKDASERCPVDRPRRSGQWFHVTLVGGGGALAYQTPRRVPREPVKT